MPGPPAPPRALPSCCAGPPSVPKPVPGDGGAVPALAVRFTTYALPYARSRLREADSGATLGARAA